MPFEKPESEAQSLRPAHHLSRAQISILEVGASGGQMARALAISGYQVIAGDIEPLPLSLAAEAGITCVQFDATQPFPFANASMHAIVMGELIEHIFDTEHLLSECFRVLTSNGILVLTTPNLARLQDRFRFLVGLSPRQVNPLHNYLKLHIRPFTYTLLKQSLTQKGFRVRRLLSNYVTFDLPSGRCIQSRLVARIFPAWGGSLILSAQKP